MSTFQIVRIVAVIVAAAVLFWLGQGLHLLNVFKDVGIQDFCSESAIESFHKGILVGLAWLDI